MSDVKLTREALQAALDPLNDDRLPRARKMNEAMIRAAARALLAATEPAGDGEMYDTYRSAARSGWEHNMDAWDAGWEASEARMRRLAGFTDDALAAGAGEGGERG
jgi:hypothetical protein